MNTTTYRESAKIYQFPTQVRRLSALHRDGGAIVERLPQRAPNAMYDDCWYHQAAINEGSALPKA